MKIKKCNPCSEVKYNEFPDLKFGRSIDGMLYFNPNLFIKAKGDIKRHSVLEFDNAFFHWKKAVEFAYSIPFDDLIIKDEASGIVLIEESLALLFVAYVDPGFAVYITEKISEILFCGVALSDSYIIMHISGNYTKKEILEYLDLYEKKQV